MSSSNKVLKNTIFYTLGNLLPQILAFCLLPIFTTYLSREDYGILSYTSTVCLYMQQLCLLGLNTYLLRYYFLCETEPDKKRLFGAIAVFVFLFDLVVLAFAWGTTPFLIRSFRISIPFSPFFPLAYLGMFFENFTIIPLIAFRVREKALTFILINVSKVALKYFLSLFLIIVFHMGVLGKFYAELAVNIVFFGMYIVFMRNYFTLCLDWKIIKKGVRFSFPFLISAILYLIVDNSDRFFLERSVALAELGVFSIAVTFYSAFSGLTQSMYRALEPTLYRSYDEPDFHQRYNDIKRYFFLTAIAAGLFSSLFIRDIVRIMTNRRFIQAAEIVPALLLVAIIFGFQTLNTAVLTAFKKTREVLFVTATGAILSLTLNALLIPRFMIWGVGLAKVIAFSAMGLLSTIFVHRCGIKQIGSDLRVVGAILLSAGVSVLLNNALQLPFTPVVILSKVLIFIATMALTVKFLGFSFGGTLKRLGNFVR